MGPRSAAWRETHLSLERLHARYALRDGSKVRIDASQDGRSVRMSALGRALDRTCPRTKIEVDIAALGIPVDLAVEWPEIERLRQALRFPAGFGTLEAPAESVYQVACFLRTLSINDTLGVDDYWFYRGQRDHHWDCVPKIMRPLREIPVDRHEAELTASLRQLRSVVGRIRRAGVADNEFDAVAIAQHYSAELGPATWLIDVTTSPWIALFFASDRGKAGDIGVIDLIIRKEWMRFSDDGTTALGALRVAGVTSVPRINRQRGFFLQAPHPDLFNELVNFRYHFRQEDGVVFESPALAPAIDRAWIYPERDEVLDKILATPQDLAVDAPALVWEPSASMIAAPTYQTYLPIARALLEHERRRLPGMAGRTRLLAWDNVLQELSRLHAVLRANPDKVPSYVTTLHHLQRVISSVMGYGNNGVTSLLQDMYFRHCKDDQERFNLMQCLYTASPFWEQVVSDRLKGRWPEDPEA